MYNTWCFFTPTLYANTQLYIQNDSLSTPISIFSLSDVFIQILIFGIINILKDRILKFLRFFYTTGVSCIVKTSVFHI